jgi:hypothetical protein
VLPVHSPGELAAAVAGGEAFALTTGTTQVDGVKSVTMISEDVALRLRAVRRPGNAQAAVDAIESALWKLAR